MMFFPTDQRQSWGRLGGQLEYLARPLFRDEIGGAHSDCVEKRQFLLATGLGRSYGDSCANGGHAVLSMTKLDRVINIDLERGILRAEAGISLDVLLRRIVPLGWFLPTTPGTRYITLGGAVANDVHGKNHHLAGTFGRWVRRIGLHRSDVGDVEISDSEHVELYSATIGGLGLTGIIKWVEIQLVPITSAFLKTSVLPFETLDDYFEIDNKNKTEFEHTVAWVDCIGSKNRDHRGLYSRSNWEAAGELIPHRSRSRLNLPVNLPKCTLNSLSLRIFNKWYFQRGQHDRSEQKQHYESVFYPLDSIKNWNRLYGRRGFYQYQAVLPEATAKVGVRALLSRISDSGQGSFLGVLKSFGAASSPGLLSFPVQGTTLAMDFPNRGSETHRLFDSLDSIVNEHHGHLYPAKDARMPTAMFCRAYSSVIDRFEQQRDLSMSSSLWRRISNCQKR